MNKDTKDTKKSSFISKGIIGTLSQNPEDKNQKTSGFAIASLVLGILAVVLGWFPIFGWIFIIAAIVFGLFALIRINKGLCSGRGIAIAGFVLGCIGLLIAIFATAAFIGAVVKDSSCADMNCLLIKANQCKTATYEEASDMGKIRYSIRLSSAGDYCILTKEIVELNKNDDPFLKKVLEGKKMQCSYYKGKFNSLWTSSMIEGLDDCNGELKGAIGQLLLLA